MLLISLVTLKCTVAGYFECILLVGELTAHFLYTAHACRGAEEQEQHGVWH